MVIEQLMAGAFFHHAAQEVAQGLLFFGTEYAEHFLVRGNCVVDDRGRDITAFAGEVGLQNAPVLGVLFSLHQAAAFQRSESELNTLRTDQQPSGEFGAGQAGFVGELAQHADLGVLTPWLLTASLTVVSEK